MPCSPGTRHRHSSHLLTWAGVPMVHSAKLQAGGFGINLEPFASSAHSSLHTFPQAAFAWNRFPKRNMKTSLFLLKKKQKKNPFKPICSGKPSRFNGCSSTRPMSQVPRCYLNPAEIPSLLSVWKHQGNKAWKVAIVR